MTKAFSICLFMTLIVFCAAGTHFDFGGSYVLYARWVMLSLMCLFIPSAPKLLPGERAGAMRGFTFAFAVLTVLSAAWSRMYPLYTLQRGVSVALFAIFVQMALWPRLKRIRDYRTLLNILVAFAWVTTTLSVGLWITGVGIPVRDISGAVQGIFGNPNTTGVVYAMLIPVVLGRFYAKKSIWNVGLFLMSLVLLWKCQSRAGLLGATVGVGAFYASYYGRKIWIPVILLFACLAVGIVLKDLATAKNDPADRKTAFNDAILRGETDSSEYGSGRIPLWMGALEKWKKRPFVGYGFGTAGDTYYHDTDVPARFHSSFIQVTAELGLVGFFFFVVPLFYSGAKALTLQTAGTDAGTRAVIAGLVGGWFGGVVDACFESWLFSVGNIACVLAWICFFAAMKGMTQQGLFEGDAADEQARGTGRGTGWRGAR